MKRTVFTALGLVLSMITLAQQVPSGFSAQYLFNHGLLKNKNSSASENLSNLTPYGSYSNTDNRFGTEEQAIELDSGTTLSSTATSTVNYRPLTVSYWVKMDKRTSGSSRLLQFYGNYSGQGTTGFQMDASFSPRGNTISWRAGMYTNGSYRAFTKSAPINNLDDGKWHHIVFRATPGSSYMDVNVFIDNRQDTLLNGNFTTPKGLGDFIRRATFKVAPLGDYEGAVDDIRIYLSSLTNKDVDDLFIEIPSKPRVIFVNQAATGRNNGTNWGDAYTDLNDAFTQAGDGDQVWVAKGKYIRTGTNRSLSFAWTADLLKVYGGFSGNITDTSLTQRDWTVNETLLSGDLGNDGNLGNNAYCVMAGPYASLIANSITSAYVDGLIIQDGYANSTSSNKYGRFGAGTFIESYVSEVEFVNCVWRNNTGVTGAGVAITAEYSTKDISFTNCKFSNNKARTAAPFDVLSYGKNLKFNMYNCLINNNEIIDLGGSNGNYGHGGRLQSYNGGTMNAYILNSTWANNQDTSSSTNKILLSTHKRFGSGNNITILKNCIMSDNGEMTNNLSYPKISGNSAANMLETYNCLIDDTTSIATNVKLNNLITSTADFIDISKADYQLKNSSKAINAGVDVKSQLPLLDLSGNPRVHNDTLDLGCFENQGKGGGSNPGDTTKTGLAQINTSALNVYPNPTSGILNISDLNEEDFNLVILSVSGKVVLETTNENHVDVSELPNGIYILQINNTSSQRFTRFIKN